MVIRQLPIPADRLLVAALAALQLSGCILARGGTEAEVHPVRGVVTYKGQPVPGATIVFHPENKTRGAVAISDEEGRFDLMTYHRGDGAIAGTYRVTVMKREPAEESQVPEDHPDYQPPDLRRPAKEPLPLVPARFSRPDSSGLVATVRAKGKNEINLALPD